MDTPRKGGGPPRKARKVGPGAAPEPPPAPSQRPPLIEDPPAKYSILIPRALDESLARLADQRGVNLSVLVRQMLENAYRQAPESGSGVVAVEIQGVLAAAVREAAGMLHASPDSAVKELVARHLPALLDEARAINRKLTEALSRDGHAK